MTDPAGSACRAVVDVVIALPDGEFETEGPDINEMTINKSMMMTIAVNTMVPQPDGLEEGRLFLDDELKEPPPNDEEPQDPVDPLLVLPKEGTWKMPPPTRPPGDVPVVFPENEPPKRPVDEPPDLPPLLLLPPKDPPLLRPPEIPPLPILSAFFQEILSAYNLSLFRC